MHTTECAAGGRRGAVDDLEAYADSFPSMGGRKVGPWLREWAAGCTSNIVEVGCWLGAGTAQLALGARRSGAPIHTYDRWKATRRETESAVRFAVELTPGQDTLPHVRERLEPFGADITYHKGQLLRARWSGEPIGLYVDDAAKRRIAWRHVLRTFAPYWQDRCIVVLMDFFHFEKKGRAYRSQYDHVHRHPDQFELLEQRLGGTSTAAFRYHRPPASSRG